MANRTIACVIHKQDFSLFSVYGRVRNMSDFIYLKVNEIGDVVLSERPIGILIDNRDNWICSKIICSLV